MVEISPSLSSLTKSPSVISSIFDLNDVITFEAIVIETFPKEKIVFFLQHSNLYFQEENETIFIWILNENGFCDIILNIYSHLENKKFIIDVKTNEIGNRIFFDFVRSLKHYLITEEKITFNEDYFSPMSSLENETINLKLLLVSSELIMESKNKIYNFGKNLFRRTKHITKDALTIYLNEIVDISIKLITGFYRKESNFYSKDRLVSVEYGMNILNSVLDKIKEYNIKINDITLDLLKNLYIPLNKYHLIIYPYYLHNIVDFSRNIKTKIYYLNKEGK